jgi:hypothetical protein
MKYDSIRSSIAVCREVRWTFTSVQVLDQTGSVKWLASGVHRRGGAKIERDSGDEDIHVP